MRPWLRDTITTAKPFTVPTFAQEVAPALSLRASHFALTRRHDIFSVPSHSAMKWQPIITYSVRVCALCLEHTCCYRFAALNFQDLRNKLLHHCSFVLAYMVFMKSVSAKFALLMRVYGFLPDPLFSERMCLRFLYRRNILWNTGKSFFLKYSPSSRIIVIIAWQSNRSNLVLSSPGALVLVHFGNTFGNYSVWKLSNT